MERKKPKKEIEFTKEEGMAVYYWIIENERRFDSVKAASEAYFLAHGRLIPPEFMDFIDYMIATNRNMNEPITDSDFLKYHQWREKAHKPLSATKKPPRSADSYQDLFYREEDAERVEALMKRPPLYRDGKYQTIYGNKSDILKAFYILVSKEIIKIRNKVKDARIFVMQFGYASDELKPDTLRKEPTMQREEKFFLELFSDL